MSRCRSEGRHGLADLGRQGIEADPEKDRQQDHLEGREDDAYRTFMVFSCVFHVFVTDFTDVYHVSLLFRDSWRGFKPRLQHQQGPQRQARDDKSRAS